VASFPLQPACTALPTAAPARQQARAVQSLSRSVAVLVCLVGLQTGAAWTAAEEPRPERFPAAEYSLSEAASGGEFAPLGSQPTSRIPSKAPRGLMPFRWPDQNEEHSFATELSRLPVEEPGRAPIAPTAFESFIGDDEANDSGIPSILSDEGQPVPPTPPGGRNPLFRDPAQPEEIPGGPTPLGPDGLPIPGRGPDDLFIPDDDQPFVLDPADDQPLGIVGRRMYRPPMLTDGMDDFFPVDDRWRLGFPAWNRYLRSRWASPWSANVIKGDYPIWGTRDKFMQVTAFSDTFMERRSVPNAAGHIDQNVFQQTVFLTADFFRGDNSFHPSEWFFTVTPAMRYTDVSLQAGQSFWTVQQGFLDLQLAVVSDYYDTTNLRLGRQAFASDFRNFVFADTNDAVRLFGTDEALRTFWNVIGFSMVQKDPVTALNTFENREQQLIMGNIIRQDFLFSGWNALAGVHYDRDTFRNHLDAFWLELAGNGRIGQFGVSAAFVQALGRDSLNPIAGRPVDINAQLFALEVTRPTDWFNPRISMMYASGDKTPGDGVGRGFDSIFDNPNFAGGGFSYLDRENIVIGGTRLSNAFSFYPSLRNKNFEPSNFVNPGLLLGNIGFDAVLSTRWQMQLNANYYEFVHPEPVAAKAGLAAVSKELGKEISLGLLYRPLIVENVIVTFGGAAFDPGAGITDLNGDNDMLWTMFTALTAVY
jgi:hypothetical protein